MQYLYIAQRHNTVFVSNISQTRDPSILSQALYTTELLSSQFACHVSNTGDHRSCFQLATASMVNGLKFQTLFSFYSQIQCWLSGLEVTKCESEQQTGKTLIRLLLQKQSDLGLHCMPRPFWQTTCVRNFRTFTVCISFTFMHRRACKI